MLSSLYNGVSALNAYGIGLETVGNNIGNLNTVAFKGHDVLFADVFAGATLYSRVDGSRIDAAGTGDRVDVSRIGSGVSVNTIRTSIAQGTFEQTGRPLDLAVDGNGYFIVKGTAEVNFGRPLFTRDGSFTVNENGFIVTETGLILQGRQVGASVPAAEGAAGIVAGQLQQDLNVSETTIAPQATKNVKIVANLDSEAAVVGPFNVANANATSNFSTSITVYDAKGAGHLVTVYFTKQALVSPIETVWDYNVVVDKADSASGLTESQVQGSLTFDANGALSAESAPAGTLAFSGGSVAAAFDFGTNITTEAGLGLDGVTQFAAPSAVVSQDQDGFTTGVLLGVSVNTKGFVNAVYSNGKTKVLGQVLLARFINPEELVSFGNNLYVDSFHSGVALVSEPDSQGAGQVLSNNLEQSNVDLAQQFVKLIEFQRGYQANSRVITTTDELLIDLINLKRT